MDDLSLSTHWTQGSSNKEEIFIPFGFPIDRIIDLSEVDDIYWTGRTSVYYNFLSATVSTTAKAMKRGGVGLLYTPMCGLVV